VHALRTADQGRECTRYFSQADLGVRRSQRQAQRLKDGRRGEEKRRHIHACIRAAVPKDSDTILTEILAQASRDSSDGQSVAILGGRAPSRPYNGGSFEVSSVPGVTNNSQKPTKGGRRTGQSTLIQTSPHTHNLWVERECQSAKPVRAALAGGARHHSQLGERRKKTVLNRSGEKYERWFPCSP